jgi:hypothetical protein
MHRTPPAPVNTALGIPMSEEHLIENIADVYRYELEFLLENI